MAQVVDRQEAVREELLRSEEVGQIGPAEPSARAAIAVLVNRLLLLQVAGIP